jgi:hypothetical protein
MLGGTPMYHLLERSGVLLVVSLSILATFVPTGSVVDADEAPAELTTPTALAGDTDCDGSVTGLDVLAVLRFVASGDGDECLRLAGNVLCDDELNQADAVAILRYISTSAVDVPTGCPELEHSIFLAPVVSIDCDLEEALQDEEVRCRYSAESYYGDVTLAWDFADGQSLLDPAALGVTCAPDGVPCWYSAWGPKTVVFEQPGEKVISLTACANGTCTTRAWPLRVLEPGSHPE